MSVVVERGAEQKIELLPLRISEFEVVVQGTSPLITHRFSEKAGKQIEDKQQKRAKQARGARDPHEEFLASTYVWPGDTAGAKKCRYGVPAVWFKQAIVAACRYVDGMKMTNLRGTFHVIAEPDSGGLVRLNYGTMQMRKDAVTIGIDSRDLRYRAEFSDWTVKLKIQYNASVVTPDQIINLLNVAGFGNGVGERRPSQKCSDQYGMFVVSPT